MCLSRKTCVSVERHVYPWIVLSVSYHTYHTKHVGLVESDRYHHLIERNVTFTPNESSEKKLTLRQTTVTR